MPIAKPFANKRVSIVSRHPAGLADAEQKVIADCVEIARALGQPRSDSETTRPKLELRLAELGRRGCRGVAGHL